MNITERCESFVREVKNYMSEFKKNIKRILICQKTWLPGGGGETYHGEENFKNPLRNKWPDFKII